MNLETDRRQITPHCKDAWESGKDKMAYVKTKKEVLRYVQSKTHAQGQQTLTQTTAYEVSKELNISRALASQYLNELTKEGAVIKINSRPVYFLDRKTLEEAHGVSLSFNSYLSISELKQALAKGNKGKHDFEKLIGSSSGLSYEVEQCKAAVKYPPRGLPILITGQNGTGKGFLASLTFEYAQNNGILTSKSTFQRFCCSEYEDAQQALDALFGLEGSADPHESQGALRRADGGILYLSDVQFLGREAQDKLAQLLDTGGYNTADQTEAMQESSARLILSSCEEPETHLSKRLLRRLPVVIHMPALSDRPVEEREQLILRFFCQESERMKKEIFISNRVFDTLLQYEFPANIEQLKNCIQSSCANALVQQEAQQDELLIYLYHLPEYLMVTARVDGRYSDEQRSMMNVRSFGKDTIAQTVGQYYDSILSEYDAYCSNHCDQDTLLRKLTQIFNDYSDYLVFSKRFANAKIDAIERVMETVFGVMSDKYYLQLPGHFNYVFSRCLYLQMRLNAPDQDERVAGCLNLLLRLFPKEALLAEEISRMIEQSLDVSINGFSQLLLVLGLRQYSQDVRMDAIRGIIICHGYSTASSIADVVNRLTGSRVFEAIDMPIDISVQEIAVRFKKYVNYVPGPKDVILLVDMGSLEDMNILLSGQTDLNLGIINNVSTRLALDVGCKIQNHTPMREILEIACSGHVSTYKLMERQKKKAAVLFVSEAGVSVARKMAELFYNSLPRQIEVEFLGYDYLSLKHAEELAELKGKYDILFVSGTANPELKDVVFIPMEDIISFREIERINRMLSLYMQEDDLQAFHQRLLKNFSLQNVVQNLTILNADKVLDLVNIGLDQMQKMMRRKFSAQTIIGLNIHISCLIERLVTKTPIETYTDQAAFEQEQKEFIEMVRKAFREVSTHYKVEFPISEIAYIYDYIIHDNHA